MKTYDVKIRGIVHRMQLSEEDAKRMGATVVAPVEEKQRVPRNKAAAGDDK